MNVFWNAPMTRSIKLSGVIGGKLWLVTTVSLAVSSNQPYILDVVRDAEWQNALGTRQKNGPDCGSAPRYPSRLTPL